MLAGPYEAGAEAQGSCVDKGREKASGGGLLGDRGQEMEAREPRASASEGNDCLLG